MLQRHCNTAFKDFQKFWPHKCKITNRLCAFPHKPCSGIRNVYFNFFNFLRLKLSLSKKTPHMKIIQLKIFFLSQKNEIRILKSLYKITTKTVAIRIIHFLAEFRNYPIPHQTMILNTFQLSPNKIYWFNCILNLSFVHLLFNMIKINFAIYF